MTIEFFCYQTIVFGAYMVKCEMLLLEFGSYLGQIVEFSRILIHLNALKATPNLREHKHLWGELNP
jgi:hypothetical protein